MKSIGKKLLSSICAFALAANGAGVMAQKKKPARQVDGKSDNVLTMAAIIDSIEITAVAPAGGGSRALEVANSGAGKGARIGGGSAFQFFSQELSFDNNLVLRSPFSADVSSETIQTLADGTRIVQGFAGRIYRDSYGRARNERAFQMGGTSESVQMINIYDPVAGASYNLDSETRVAHKMDVPVKNRMHPRPPLLSASVSPSAPADAEPAKKDNALSQLTPGKAVKKVQPSYPPTAKAARVSGLSQVEILISETGEIIKAELVSGHPLFKDEVIQAARQWRFTPTLLSSRPVKIKGLLNFSFTLIDEAPTPAQDGRSAAKYAFKTEQLRNQIIEGVECEGARTITTIPVGAIGNDRPIEIVSETWRSPELSMIILSKRSDPRFGESTYRVTNIARAEPESSLFQIPSDYVTEEGKN